MLLEALILALAAGLIFGGSIRNLLDVRIRWPGFIFAGLILRYIPWLVSRYYPAVFGLPFLRDRGIGQMTVAAVFFIASYIYLIAGVAANLTDWPMFIVFEGVVMNFAAVAANGGFMPVSASGLINAGYPMERITGGIIDMNHVLETGSTRLMIFADIFVVKNPFTFPQMLSIGDYFMCAGLFIFIGRAMLRSSERSLLRGRSADGARDIDKLRAQ